MFRLGFDKKTIGIVLVIMVLMKLLSGGIEGMMAGLLNLLLLLPAVLIAFTFHEYAHAYTAYRLGDETPKLQGRLNLNPITHIDPVGFIFLIVAGFGWGKPVEINPKNFNSKYSLSKAEAIVAVAGPITNFIIAFIFLIITYVIFIATDIGANMGLKVAQILYPVLLYTVSINIGLGIFNLIPLPPLDGSKVLMHFLSYKGKQWFFNNEQIFYIVFLLIWITGLSSFIIDPIFEFVFNGMNWAVTSIVGLFM